MGPDAKLNSDAYKALEAGGTRIYGAPTLPMMSTGATDMAQLRAKGVQCFGIRLVVSEDAPKGFGRTATRSGCLRANCTGSCASILDVVVNLARAQ